MEVQRLYIGISQGDATRMQSWSRDGFVVASASGIQINDHFPYKFHFEKHAQDLRSRKMGFLREDIERACVSINGSFWVDPDSNLMTITVVNGSGEYVLAIGLPGDFAFLCINPPTEGHPQTKVTFKCHVIDFDEISSSPPIQRVHFFELLGDRKVLRLILQPSLEFGLTAISFSFGTDNEWSPGIVQL